MFPIWIMDCKLFQTKRKGDIIIMDFKSNKPIYMQIVDFCFGQILSRNWNGDERIPSVRELGVQLQVNPNTVMRAFDYMQTEEVIYPRRGMGYYVQANAAGQIKKVQKKEFFDEILPETFKSMQMLDISIDEIVEEYKKYDKR